MQGRDAMKGGAGIAAILALMAAAAGAAAQPLDPAAEQHCIWSCLYNSPGAASAQYAACLRQHCEMQPPAPMRPVVTAEPGMPVSPRPKARLGAGLGAGLEPPPQPKPVPPIAQGEAADGWHVAPSPGGAGMVAGVSDPATGARLDWICAKGIRSHWRITPYAGSGGLVITVERRAQDFAVVRDGAAALLLAGFDAPSFQHLVSGAVAEIADDAGRVIGRFAMAGAPVTIGQAEGWCQV